MSIPGFCVNLIDESLALSRRQKAHGWIEWHAVFALANMAYWRLDIVSSSALFEACVVLARQVGDAQMLGTSLNELGDAVTAQLDFARAATLCEEALQIFRQTVNPTSLEEVLHRLAVALLLLGQLDRAQVYAEEMYLISLEYDLRNGVGGALSLLGHIARDQGEYTQATLRFKESLVWYHQKTTTLSNWGGIALAGLGTVASLQGQHPRAARLYGAIEAWQQRLNMLRLPHNQILHGRHIATTRTALGDAAYEAAFAEGQAMTSQQAFEYALEGGDPKETVEAKHSGVRRG